MIARAIPQVHRPGSLLTSAARSIGNALAPDRDHLTFLRTIAAYHGEAVGFRRGRQDFVLINSPELVRGLFVDRANDFDKGKIQHSTFRALLGNTLSLREGPSHRRQRKALSLLFAAPRRELYAGRIVSYATSRITRWRDNAQIELVQELTDLSIGAFAFVLLGVDLFDGSRELNRSRAEIWNWVEHVALRRVAIPLNWPTPRNVRAARAIGDLRRQLGRHVRERLVGTRDSEDLLSALLAARTEEGGRLTESEICDELVGLLFAAHETNANALLWSLYELGKAPSLQARLRLEVDGVLGQRAPTSADLTRLPYTRAVVDEALRLYPPSPRQFRFALRDTQLGAYAIPKGTCVMVSQYVLHRNPALFPEPDRFDPERFLPQRESKVQQYSYIPFGAGHRTCLGRQYAQMEAALILALLTQRFDLDLRSSEGIGARLGVTLRPDRPMPAVISRRT